MNGPRRYEYHIRTVSVRVAAPQDAQSREIGDPQTAAATIAELLKIDAHDADAELFGIITADSRQRLTGYKILTTGTRTQAPVDPAKLYRVALALDATGIIAFHTHPSGVMEPSRDDIELTRRLARAGEALGLPLWDHMILDGGETSRWLSLRRSRPGLFTTTGAAT
jgi:DNA repair protein RadC